MNMTEPAVPMAPFVGLRPFRTADAAWFFGRERESAVLSRKIRSNRFTAVVGASGSGKSSLVLAGVLPELQADSWKAIVAKPGSTPITRLAETLADAASEEDDGLTRARMFQFDASLRASAFGLTEITAKLTPAAPRLILVVDQFEELFRYGEDAGGSERAAMREEGRAFVELLLAGAARIGGRLHVVLTMRSDYFGDCSLYQGLAEAVSGSQYLVAVPGRDQLEVAIRGPVKKAGATIEDGLVQHLLVDVEEETDRLPLLQHTLRRLWERAMGEPLTLREADYVAVGGLAGSIDRKAETVLKALADSHSEDASTAERVMKALTELDEHDRASRRAQRKSDLLALVADNPGSKDAAAASLERVLRALAAEDASFVHIGHGVDPEVDISHEALIRCWKRLAGDDLDFKSGWLHDERKDGERWRAYVRRASEQSWLSAREQYTLSKWLRKKGLGRAWSERHHNEWDSVKKLRQKSLVPPVFALSLLVVILSVVSESLYWAAKRGLPLEVLRERWAYLLGNKDLPLPELVEIPAGLFMMGSEVPPPPTAEKVLPVRPVHRVTFAQPFYLGRTEVTFQEWDACVADGECHGHRPDDNHWHRDEQPVINVSWVDAKAYVEWLSRKTGKNCRLPSEAEWEYAARAGTTTEYALPASVGSDDIKGKGLANCAECGSEWDNKRTAPVAQFPANAWGLYDMHGNVWEWVEDCVHNNYDDAPDDGRAWREENGGDCSSRVLRGGSWYGIPVLVRSSDRLRYDPTERVNSFGFRVVCSSVPIIGP